MKVIFVSTNFVLQGLVAGLDSCLVIRTEPNHSYVPLVRLNFCSFAHFLYHALLPIFVSLSTHPPFRFRLILPIFPGYLPSSVLKPERSTEELRARGSSAPTDIIQKTEALRGWSGAQPAFNPLSL